MKVKSFNQYWEEKGELFTLLNVPKSAAKQIWSEATDNMSILVERLLEGESVKKIKKELD